jgi:bifunctional non-homologous end joining protein LigD
VFVSALAATRLASRGGAAYGRVERKEGGMPLGEYTEKRDFGHTPNSARDTGRSPEDPAGELRFVVHKHESSHLHYDFRLEWGGVLLSWAVPKGPSLDPRDKRLAVQVEDHPVEYADFEGVIPEGDYGGGTVMVWDRGTYEPRGDMAEMRAAGSIKVDLHGEKLRGGFALVRMKRRKDETHDNWLLIKERDEEARPHNSCDVLTERPDSVKTGRSMREIAADD